MLTSTFFLLPYRKFCPQFSPPLQKKLSESYAESHDDMNGDVLKTVSSFTTHEGNRVSGQRLLKLWWCLTINLPINTRIVNIFLETVTLKSLLRWVLNLSGLCLTTNGTIPTFEKCKKL